MDRKEGSLRLLRILLRGSRSVTRSLEYNVEEQDVKFMEFAVLELLYHKGPHPTQEISSNILIANSSLTYVLNKLEDKGFLTRKPGEKDKRVSVVALTPEGETFIEGFFPIHQDFIVDLFSDLEDDELESLAEGLKKIGLKAQIYNEDQKQK